MEKDMYVEAQKFMNTHGVKVCYECDGRLYKHRENAEARKIMSGGKEVITHTANAGAATSE